VVQHGTEEARGNERDPGGRDTFEQCEHDRGRHQWSDEDGEVCNEVLADKMSSAWIAFARTGNPSNPTTGNWPAYGPARATMMFDNETKVVNDPAGAERHLWTTVIG
jgi:carboxylesterase type B